MPQHRNTIQKEQVYAAVCALANHPTADEVYEKVRSGFPTISRATVYRILNQMADSGVIGRIRVPDFANHYDHCSEPHHHAMCVSCGRVYDVKVCPEVEIDYSSVNAGGLEILGHNLIFETVCGDCGGKEL